MNNNFEAVKADLDSFIKGNKITGLINSLNVSDDINILNEPAATYGHTFGNYDFTMELNRRIEKAGSSQTLGEHVEALYQEKKKVYPDILKDAGINRAYKYKVVNDVIKPSKSKLLCIAIAFRLNLEETEKLLRKAGYSLARENTIFDAIIGYFIEEGFYSTIDIDIYLEEYDQPTIFSIA